MDQGKAPPGHSQACGGCRRCARIGCATVVEPVVVVNQASDPAIATRSEIWLLDHNYNLWTRVRSQMQDPELRKYVSGVAWHGYLGTPDLMSRLHKVEPQLPFYWTEGGPDVTDPQYAYDWTRWGSIFTAAISN